MARAFTNHDWRRCDWLLLAIVGLLVALALPTIYSAALTGGTGPAASGLAPVASAPALALVKRQVLWLLVGLLMVWLVNSLDYHQFADLAPHLYRLSLLGLVTVLLFGTTVNGAKAWFHFGPVALQPSELTKIAVILALARLFSHSSDGGVGGSDGLRSAMLLGVPVVLILLQPDLGTVLSFVAVWLAMLSWAGARWWQIGLVVLLGVLLFGLMWKLNVLHDYQKDRINVLFNPDVDPRGVGYNLRQALVAVGSGGVGGKGWLQGTQTHLRFLPEGQTDFIFAVWNEERGLLGGLALLAIYAGLFWRIWGTLTVADSEFGRQLVIGCGALLLFHVLLNAGMVLGLLPITGLPLPFFSYGGSNLVTSLVLVGIVLNVGMRRRGID